jgi:ATP-dependent Clp protease ATP-binding subunit ClpA
MMQHVNVILDPMQKSAEARTFEASLRALVIGQEEAIEQVVNAYEAYVTGLVSPDRPIANFLFLGPTGSGKTRMVEAVAESLLRNPRAVVKIDCAEFQHSHEIAKLIGSPPGYLGHRETHALLSQEALNHYHTETMKISFVLFDEIEKASDALWNLLLGILDKGALTLGDNRKVDFSRAMIFMTSNLGAAEMSALVAPRFGFSTSSRAEEHPSGASLGEKLEHTGVAAARRRFTPEFMNRLDKIVTFKPLGRDHLDQILEIELKMVEQRILNASPQRSFHFELTGAAKELLLFQGTDIKYGARPLKRAIERLLVQPICSLIGTQQVRGGDSVQIDWEGRLERLTFIKVAEGIPQSGAIEAPVRAATTGAVTAGRGILSDVVRARARLSKVI